MLEKLFTMNKKLGNRTPKPQTLKWWRELVNNNKFLVELILDRSFVYWSVIAQPPD